MPGPWNKRYAYRGGRYQTSEGYYWIQTPTEALGELTNVYIEQLHLSVKALADGKAPGIEAWMRENAGWQDRTGAARAGLYARVSEVPNQSVTITIGHSVHYGLFLEVNYAGRYAIINPALDKFGPEIWADVVRLTQR